MLARYVACRVESPTRLILADYRVGGRCLAKPTRPVSGCGKHTSACHSICEHVPMLTLSIGRHRSRAAAQPAARDDSTGDGMLRCVQREIWPWILARCSFVITSRLESRRLGCSRRTCDSYSQRRRWCRWQHDRSQVVDFETRSCYFIGLIDHTFGRNVQSLRAVGASGVEVPRLKVHHRESG